MDRLEAASILLRHVGGPSMLVSGQASALPDGDRVGTLLRNITPSMAARLARQAGRQWRGAGPIVGHSRSGPISMAEAVRRRHRGPAVQPAGAAPTGPVLVSRELRIECGYRPAPVQSGAESGGPRGFQEAANEPRPVRAPLGWPWQAPLPSGPCAGPSPAVRPYDPPPFVGTLIDLVA